MLPFLGSLKDFSSKARSFSDLLPYAVKHGPDIIINTDGALMATYRYQATDLGAANGFQRDKVSVRVNQALARFQPGWMFHFSTERVPAVEYPIGSEFPDPTSWVIDESRDVTFRSEGSHYTNEYWLDITYLPPTDGSNKGQEFLMEGQETVGAEYAADENLKNFQQNLRAFEDLVSDDLHLERIGQSILDEEEGPVIVDDQIAHLIKCATNKVMSPRALPPNGWVSALVGCERINNGFQMRIGNQIVSVFTITDMPDLCRNGMFDLLAQVQCQYRATWRYIVRNQDAALKDIVKERDKWFGRRRSATDALQNKETAFPNQDAMRMAADASLAETDARSGEAIFGYFTMSVTLWEPIGYSESKTQEESENIAWTRLIKNQEYLTSSIHRNLHFQTFFEQENVLEAHLGTLPGIGHAQLRKPMLSSKNLVDFIPTSAIWAGQKFNPCDFYPAESPPLAYVSTTGGTPFSFNVHVGDVGHFLVTGQTSAGKSVLLGFLLAQHRRYINSRQIVFDVDRSHYVLTNAVGGKHYEVKPDGSAVGFAPLAHIDEEAERAWAEGWVLNLLANSGYVEERTVMSKREQIVKALYLLSRQPKPWSLTALSTMPMLDADVRNGIQSFTVAEEGTGGLLDAEEDTLSTSDFICFEMRPIMDAGPGLQIPTLMYLFHYVDRLCNGRPTMLLMEEVWSFLDSEQAAEAIRDWLKTLRKRNVSVGFANQSLEEFINHSISPTIIQNCKTKILLANPEATTAKQREAYEKIGLTSWQIGQISRARRQRDYFIMSPLGRRLISLDLDQIALAFVGVSNITEVQRVKKMIEEENHILMKNATPTLKEHIPWQARWLKEKVDKKNPGLGEGWANAWLDQWEQMGGYTRSASITAANSGRPNKAA